MILRSLELKHFGKFGEKTFEFRRGMNLVIGPNEAGKSTLMEAIPAVLFGVRNKERFKPWGRQGSCEAALVLEDRGRTLRIERNILTDRVSLEEKDDLYHTLYSFEGKVAPQGRSSERVEYLEQLSRLFGIADEDIFRASLFFGQGSLEIGNNGGLAAKIKTLLSGFVEVDYDRVLESLHEDFFAITRKNPWGKDKTKDREFDEIASRVGELEKRWYEGQQSLKRLEKLQEQIEDLSVALEIDREDYTKGERYLAWVRKQWQLEAKEESLQKDFTRINQQSEKVTELQKQLKDFEARLAKTGLPRDMPEDLPRILADAEKVRKDLVTVQSESAGLREQLLKLKRAPLKQTLAASVVLLGAGGAVGWQYPQWLTPALLGAGLLSALVWMAYLWRAGKERGERNRLQGQAQILERQREEAQARLAGLDTRFERIGMSPSAIEVVKMQKSLERNRELVGQLREVESAMRVLEKAEELERDKQELTRELAVIDQRLEDERPLRQDNLLTPEELPEAEEKLGDLGESIKAREQDLLELAREEAALQGELHDLQQIEEEGERLKEREAFLRRRRDALGTAYDLLSGAVEEFRNSYLERFSAEIGHHLGTATCGRYAEARLDGDFNLSLKGSGDNWQDVEHFSRGTVDAVYFAVRLALTRHMASGRHLPLLLDDPLVNFDEARLLETLKGLEQIGHEHQVIFFTHDEGMLRRGAHKRWNVVSLGKIKSAKSSMSEERRDDVGQLHLL